MSDGPSAPYCSGLSLDWILRFAASIPRLSSASPGKRRGALDTPLEPVMGLAKARPGGGV